MKSLCVRQHQVGATRYAIFKEVEDLLHRKRSHSPSSGGMRYLLVFLLLTIVQDLTAFRCPDEQGPVPSTFAAMGGIMCTHFCTRVRVRHSVP
ncbi:hypothetical protein Y032_0007g3484 [Ancylostoma ceylanicum]|nr:hypothetical protein Y032_0007g3484 [Ancylostoma ceylanicum]